MSPRPALLPAPTTATAQVSSLTMCLRLFSKHHGLTLEMILSKYRATETHLSRSVS